MPLAGRKEKATNTCAYILEIVSFPLNLTEFLEAFF